MTVYEILKQLEATSKKNEKEAILKEHFGNEVLKRCFEYAYSPTIQFFMKKLPEANVFPEAVGSLERGLDAILNLAQRVYTGNDAKDYLSQVLFTTQQGDREVLERVILKDLRCGVGDSTINKVWKGLIVKPPRQGAKSMNEKTLAAVCKSPDLYVELKSDGSYAAFNGIGLMSRNGNVLDIPCLEEHLNSGCFPKVALEGELVYSTDKATREAGNGIITKIVKGTASEEEQAGAIYQIWDCIPLEDYQPKGKCRYTNVQRRKSLEIRYKAYLEWCEDRCVEPRVQLIPRSSVKSLEEAYEVFETYVKEGFEGAILKDGNAGWSDNGKPSCCVKMKRKDTADLEVVGIYEGEGKAKGMLGGLILQSSCSIINVKVGSGFSDDQRKEFFENPNLVLGKIVEVEYDSITQDKKTKVFSLFLPIFKQVRVDKNEADSKEEIEAKVRIKVKK